MLCAADPEKETIASMPPFFPRQYAGLHPLAVEYSLRP